MIISIVEGDRADKLELRWTDTASGAVVFPLSKKIDAMQGIEKVYPHRYSIEVFIAPHVVSREFIAKEIRKIRISGVEFI